MKRILLSILLIPTVYADPTAQIESPEVYQEVLKRHVKEGHISKDDVEKQKFYFEKDKEWRSEYGERLRGVASSLKSPREIIELENPAIEIPVN